MKIILVLLALLYALFPYDILPDFIPGWGWLDDLVILFLLWRSVLSPARGKSRQDGTFHKGPWPGRGPHQGNSFGRQRHGRQDGESGGKDPYAVLGLSRNASKEEIRKAYRDLAIKYHPDKVSHLGNEFKELAEARFKEIQQAYQTLLKSQER